MSAKRPYNLTNKVEWTHKYGQENFANEIMDTH